MATRPSECGLCNMDHPSTKECPVRRPFKLVIAIEMRHESRATLERIRAYVVDKAHEAAIEAQAGVSGSGPVMITDRIMNGRKTRISDC